MTGKAILYAPGLTDGRRIETYGLDRGYAARREAIAVGSVELYVVVQGKCEGLLFSDYVSTGVKMSS